MEWRNRVGRIPVPLRLGIAAVAAVAATAVVGSAWSGDSATTVAANHAESEQPAAAANDKRGGSINDRPAPASRDRHEPVGLRQAAEVRSVRIQLTSVEAVDAKAFVPGEISGPGVAITVTITNRTGRTVSLDHITVDLVDNDGQSASPITVEGRTPLSGQLGPGRSASGAYVFTIPEDDRDSAEVHVTYDAPPAPILTFRGDLPDA